MDSWAYFRFTGISVLIGLSFFCISYAGWVWRRRRAAPAREASAGVLKSLRGWSLVAIVGGVVMMLAVFAVREVVPQNGRLELDEAFAVRSRRDAELDYLVPPGAIRAGEEIARFRSPALEADAAVLEARLARLQTQKDAIELELPEINPELVRRHQLALDRSTQLTQLIFGLLPEQQTMIRSGMESRLERTDTSVALESDIITFEKEIRQGELKLKFLNSEYERGLKLWTSGSMARSQLEEMQRDVEVAATEVHRLRQGLEQLRREQQQLQSAATRFDELVGQQASSIGNELQGFKTELQVVRASLGQLEEQLAADKQRARQLHAAEQMQIALQIRESQAELAGVRRKAVVTAPFDGQVVYRNNASNTVEEHGVMLVVARNAGAKVEFIAPHAGVDTIRRNSQVDVWVPESSYARRLTATFAEATPSPWESGQSLITVYCRPPPDVIFKLANSQSVPVRISWKPPLFTIPTFQLGGGLLAGGLCSWLLVTVCGWIIRPFVRSSSVPGAADSEAISDRAAAQATDSLETPAAEAVQLPVRPATPVVPAPVFATRAAASRTGLHHGATGTMLVMLGARLREAILNGDVDHDLVSSVEWALDRHQSRAISLIRDGLLGRSDGMELEISELTAALHSYRSSSEDWSALADRVRRVLSVLSHVRETTLTEVGE